MFRQSENQSENQSEKKCGKISQVVLLAVKYCKKKLLKKSEKNHQNLVNTFSLQEYMELL